MNELLCYDKIYCIFSLNTFTLDTSPVRHCKHLRGLGVTLYPCQSNSYQACKKPFSYLNNLFLYFICGFNIGEHALESPYACALRVSENTSGARFILAPLTGFSQHPPLAVFHFLARSLSLSRWNSVVR